MSSLDLSFWSVSAFGIWDQDFVSFSFERQPPSSVLVSNPNIEGGRQLTVPFSHVLSEEVNCKIGYILLTHKHQRHFYTCTVCRAGPCWHRTFWRGWPLRWGSCPLPWHWPGRSAARRPSPCRPPRCRSCWRGGWGGRWSRWPPPSSGWRQEAPPVRSTSCSCGLWGRECLSQTGDSLFDILRLENHQGSSPQWRWRSHKGRRAGTVPGGSWTLT